VAATGEIDEEVDYATSKSIRGSAGGKLVPSTYQTASDLKLSKAELRQGGKEEC
jgi:hypothetical protein